MDKLTKKMVITILSIIITTVFGQLFKIKPIGMFYTAITCVIITNVDFDELIKASKFRAIGTIIGGVMGIIFSYIPIFLILKIIIGEIGIILFCEKKLNIPSAIASIVFLITVYNITPEPSYLYGLKRVLDTFAGILVTFVVTYSLKKF